MGIIPTLSALELLPRGVEKCFISPLCPQT